jgi:hypothetical protein
MRKQKVKKNKKNKNNNNKQQAKQNDEIGTAYLTCPPLKRPIYAAQNKTPFPNLFFEIKDFEKLGGGSRSLAYSFLPG